MGRKFIEVNTGVAELGKVPQGTPGGVEIGEEFLGIGGEFVEEGVRAVRRVLIRPRGHEQRVADLAIDEQLGAAETGAANRR